MPADPRQAERARGGDGGVISLAVYPLAIPAIDGPGTMHAVMLLTDNDRFSIVAADRQERRQHLRRVMGMILASVALNLVLTVLGGRLELPNL